MNRVVELVRLRYPPASAITPIAFGTRPGLNVQCASANTAVFTLQTLIEHPGRQLPNSYYRPVLRKRASSGPLRKTAKTRAAS